MAPPSRTLKHNKATHKLYRYMRSLFFLLLHCSRIITISFPALWRSSSFIFLLSLSLIFMGSLHFLSQLRIVCEVSLILIMSFLIYFFLYAAAWARISFALDMAASVRSSLPSSLASSYRFSPGSNSRIRVTVPVISSPLFSIR